jgi:imidazolonepropionase-like amidohydrolase
VVIAPERTSIVGNTAGTSAEGLAITNARLLDGTGDAIDSGTVLVRDGRIVSVSPGPADTSGAFVLDAEGRTVMPGYIDAHRHVIDGDGPQWLAEQAVDRMREFLEAGFTTVLSAGDAEESILDLRRRLDAGELVGPRLIASARAPLARAAGRAGGGGRGGDPARTDASRAPRTTRAMPVPPDETRARIQEIARRGFDAVKTVIIVTPGGPEKGTLAIVAEEARKAGIKSITHAVTVEDTIAAVEAKTDVLVHTPHIGQLTEEQAKMIAASGIPMMSTLGVFVPFFDADNKPIFRDALPYPWPTLSSAGQGPVNARLLFEAGITYGYGTDTRFLPRETLAHELKSLNLVFSERDIVPILTRNAAVTIGRADELGTLDPGKLADIVIVDGDPLEDLHDLLKVKVVVKGGAVVVDRR